MLIGRPEDYRDLSDNENEQMEATWKSLHEHHVTKRGTGLSPCYILKDHRDKYRCGGMRPAVVAFAYKWKKLPIKDWWLNRDDDGDDGKVDDEKKGNDKEENDDDDHGDDDDGDDDDGDVEMKNVSDIGGNDGKREADDDVAVDGVVDGDDDAKRNDDRKKDDDEKKDEDEKKERVPTPEFSHVCGARDCIEPSHVVYEWKKQNRDRDHCHWIIREFKKLHRNDPSVGSHLNVANVRTRDASKRQCPHGLASPDDQACFVNFGSTRVNARRAVSQPNTNNRQLRSTRVRVLAAHKKRERRSIRKGQTIIVNNQIGWIRAVDGNRRFLFCVRNGGRRWVSQDSRDIER